MSRTAKSALSKENESYIAQGWYPHPVTSAAVDLRTRVNTARRAVMSYDLGAVERILSSTTSPSPSLPTRLLVTAETSTAAAARLHSEGAPRIAILNFASARNPGGGYLGGATAQEEDICRSSALYTTLLEAPDFYAAHKHADGRYSHRIVYSPTVPVYRSTTSQLLPEPYTVDFITSAAPNVGSLERNHPQYLPEVGGILRERAARILAVCAHHGAHTLVLGAWGCGVFKNRPADVARVFHDLLKPGGAFHGRFESAVFAIYDTSRSQNVMNAFTGEFGTRSGAQTAAPSTAASWRSGANAGNGRANGGSSSSTPRSPPSATTGNKPKVPAKDKTDGQARITSFFQANPRDS